METDRSSTSSNTTTAPVRTIVWAFILLLLPSVFYLDVGKQLTVIYLVDSTRTDMSSLLMSNVGAAGSSPPCLTTVPTSSVGFTDLPTDSREVSFPL